MTFRTTFAALFALIALIISGPASQAQDTFVVKSIEIQYVGPESISKDKILSNMRTRVGKTYSPQIVEEDIRSLYRTGNLANVRIFGEPSGDGVKVIVVVATKASVSAVNIEGASRVKVSRLRDEITTKPGDSLSESTLEADRQKILDYYRGKGFSDVEVTSKVDTNDQTGSANVTFNITEGAKTKIGKVRFEGNDHIKRRDILKVIKTKPKSVLNMFSSTAGKLSSEQLDEDVQAIRALFQSKGFVDVNVNAPVIDQQDGRVNITFVIVEGREYRVGKVVYSGADVFPLDELTKNLKVKSGAVYSPQAVRSDVSTMQDLYGSKGYIDLQVMASPQPLPSGEVDVNFRIEEGIQSYVEKINISGNTRTKDKVIRREMAVAPGDLFNSVRVNSSKDRLTNLQYFGKVETFPSETLVPGRKDLNVVVEEKRTGSFNFGAGFSSIDNLIGFAEITQGNFDIKNWPRFTGAGQKFRMRVQYGTRRKDFVIALTEPYFLDQRLSLGGELYYRDASYTSRVYDEQRYGTAINLRKPINEFTAVRFEYRLENINLHSFDEDVSAIIRQEEGDRLKSQVSAGITWDKRDRVYLPRKGHRVDFLTYYAGGFIGGDSDIYGFDLEASKYFHLPGDTILTIEGEIAGVDTHGSGDRVPIYDRLYLGGSNDLRGFRYRDVGPKDENDEPIGGLTMARMTIEYTFPIVEAIRGAIFYDVGMVSSDAWDFGGGINSDVGIGALLQIPAIGPIRIDYGIPLQTDDDSGGGGKFNFNVGYKF